MKGVAPFSSENMLSLCLAIVGSARAPVDERVKLSKIVSYSFGLLLRLSLVCSNSF